MKILVAALVLSASFSALAIKPLAPSIDPLIFKNTSSAFEPIFEGIVSLSNCSGSLVRFNGAPLSKKAIMMTNGHCLSGLGNNEVWVNKPSPRMSSVFDQQKNLHPLQLSRVIYATQVDTDVTFYEAKMTYQEILDQYGVEALTIGEDLVAVGTPISIVSGYWKILTSCEAEAIAPILREGEWIWKNSIRYSSKCMTKGGYSGSPVIADNTRTVVGIHNTGNNGKLDCSDMNPCEQNENGELIFAEPNRRYAQQVYPFYDCLDENFDFDLSLQNCSVPKP